MNAKKKLILTSLALVILLVSASILYSTLSKKYQPDSLTKKEQNENTAADTETDTERVKAPDFSVTDTNGNTVKLSDFQGKPVVLNFWASWCPPCKEEMPDFEKMYTEFGEDVVFMMVNATDGRRETVEKASDFIANSGFTFPVYYDTAQEASYSYGISSLPSTAFIDADGYLVTGAVGMIDAASLQKGIDLILKTY